MDKCSEASSGSKQCASSSLTSDDDVSSLEIRARKVKLMAVVARCHDINLQVLFVSIDDLDLALIYYFFEFIFMWLCFCLIVLLF